MTTEDSHASISMPPPRILHMDVEDPVREVTDELDVVNSLIAEVAGVIIESKSRMPSDGLNGPCCRRDVEGDFRWVNF